MPFCTNCGVQIPSGVPACIACGPVRAPEPEAETEYHEFSFTGDGHEYFRIWIVNLALSVITLGIYSAWAKVRRQQYFHRNVRVADAGFDYHGRPIAILKGRVIAFALLGTYYLAGYLNIVAGLVAGVVLAAVLPWLLVRSLRFTLHNTSYRAIRFSFHGQTLDAYTVLLGLPLLNIPTFGLLTPLVHHRFKRFQHANAAFGRSRFAFGASVGAFYRVYLFIALVVFLMFIFMAFAIGIVIAGTFLANPPSPGQPPPPMPTGVAVTFLVLYALTLTTVWSMVTTEIQNLSWRHTTLGAHRFASTLETHKLLGLVLVNTLAIVATLGLFKPYADIRLTRYFVSEMTLVASGSLDHFVADTSAEVGALGDEALEMFDIDIGF